MAKYSATGPSRSAGKNVNAPTTRMTPSQNTANNRVSVRKVPVVTAIVGLRRDRARNRHHEDDRRIATDQDDESRRQVVPRRIGIEPRECRAVVGGRSAEGVEDLGVAVRAGVRHRGEAVGRDHRPPSRREDEERVEQKGERDQDDLGLFDLLAEELGSPADHEPGDEDRDDAVDERREEPDALSTEHALQHHAGEEGHGAEWREAVMHRVHASGREGRRNGSEQSALGDAEADFLAFHVAAWLARSCRHFDTGLRQRRRCRPVRPRS